MHPFCIHIQINLWNKLIALTYLNVIFKYFIKIISLINKNILIRHINK